MRPQKFWVMGASSVLLGVTLLAWQLQSRAADDRLVMAPESEMDNSEIMAAKLTAAHRVLTGLVARDSAMIKGAGKDLVALCKTAAWRSVEEDPVYTHFSVEFQRLSERLVRLAEEENLDGAAYAYQGLTSTCISCHEHVRDVKPIQPASAVRPAN
ncbi:hypothetical protein Mal4_29770 [Maioricimonas rarisocia]|uniref:Cytochrome C n=1 Tax=Maioricimonas rarisocia TaxID=2528026 RepID=A0A517Z839_9PLAN|nr:hypothetical protein [Maioricimonas rarisocia]QDU38647.1 hypothetical protein Mal4_29770 [Maioricimonas rarisocia]